MGAGVISRGNVLQFLCNNVVKLEHPDMKRKAAEEKAKAPKKAKAASKKSKASEGEDSEPKPKSLSGYQLFMKENREAVKATVDETLSAKEANALIMKGVAAKWQELDEKEKEEWKEKAKSVVVEPKAKKDAPKRGKLDQDALKARMDEDGWETIEKTNDDGRVIKLYQRNDSKKHRSLLEVARAHYPELLVES